jgi:hypothetical protein
MFAYRVVVVEAVLFMETVVVTEVLADLVVNQHLVASFVVVVEAVAVVIKEDNLREVLDQPPLIIF